MASHIEREDKYDVDSAFDLPRALGPDGAGAGIAAEHEIDNMYWDTADGALRMFGATLRRRSGGADDGWHLKLPRADGARMELHSDDPSALAPPEDLVRRIAGIVRGRPLVEVARLRERRLSYLVRDGAGAPLVEVDDGEVRATVRGDAAIAIAWREVEIEEAAEGAEATQLRRALGRRLRGGGARRSAYPSKLEHALHVAHGDSPVDPAAEESDNPLVAYVRAQYADLIAGDLELRAGPASVHRTRVASRRLRSTLRSFASLLDASALDGLEDELRWYAEVLGAVREQEVLGERLVAQARGMAAQLDIGPVVDAIERDVAAATAAGRAGLSEALDSPRYFALLDATRRLAADPPFRRRLRRARLESAARRAQRTAVKRLRGALGAHGSDVQLHRARKAAKRARYAAEALAASDRSQARAALRFEQLQEILGEHQDAVVAADTARRLGVADDAGAVGFSFGLLCAAQQHAAAQARREARRWLRRGR